MGLWMLTRSNSRPICLCMIVVLVMVSSLGYEKSAWGQAPIVVSEHPLFDTISIESPSTTTEVPVRQETQYPTVRITGVFQIDAVYNIQSARNRATVGDVNSALDFPRARVAAVGNLSENIAYNLEFDFAASQPRFIDNWVTFGQVPGVGNIRIGRFRQPFGMTELTSIRDLPFLERPTPFALSPFRQTGIMAFDAVANDRVTYAVSGYRYNTDPFGNVSGDAGGYGLATRLTTIPWMMSDNHLIHLGVGYSLNDPAEPNQVRFQSTPEIIAGDVTGSIFTASSNSIPSFVDTGLLTVGQNHHYNIEAAYVHNNFALQGEARALMVDQVGSGSQTLPAFYTQARYVLTGEKIPYDKNEAVFTRIKPRCGIDKGGMGAWELAFRWSFIDLGGTKGVASNDPTGMLAPGRKLNNLTLGLNWYLIDNAKIQFNYIHSILDDRTFGVTNTDIFALRCQVAF